MKWWSSNVAPALIVAFIIGCFGFFMDFQGLKAKVFGIEVKFDHIRNDLQEIKSDLKEIKRRGL